MSIADEGNGSQSKSICKNTKYVNRPLEKLTQCREFLVVDSVRKGATAMNHFSTVASAGEDLIAGEV